MRINEGYEIICSVPISEKEELVIGRNSYNFVVWHCRNGNDYYWGHYVDNYFRALKELAKIINWSV